MAPACPRGLGRGLSTGRHPGKGLPGVQRERSDLICVPRWPPLLGCLSLLALWAGHRDLPHFLSQGTGGPERRRDGATVSALVSGSSWVSPQYGEFTPGLRAPRPEGRWPHSSSAHAEDTRPGRGLSCQHAAGPVTAVLTAADGLAGELLGFISANLCACRFIPQIHAGAGPEPGMQRRDGSGSALPPGPAFPGGGASRRDGSSVPSEWVMIRCVRASHRARDLVQSHS